MISWRYFPANYNCPEGLLLVVGVFEKNADRISSTNHQLASNDVLTAISSDMTKLGYRVESGKARDSKIRIPVLFGNNGRVNLAFEADAYNAESGIVMEVEAGRAVTNYQFLKDLFQACMMLDVSYFVIAVRNVYRKAKDFEKVVSFFDALYTSGKLKLPLKGVLVIGY